MPWGSAVIGEGLCDILGNQRSLARADIMTYRSWPFVKFILTMTPSVFGKVWPWTLGYLVFATAVVCVDNYLFDLTLPNKEVLGMFTTPTGFLLLFRCNMGYSRFWEGR